jgi:hypothetical protein
MMWIHILNEYIRIFSQSCEREIYLLEIAYVVDVVEESYVSVVVVDRLFYPYVPYWD